MGKRFAFCGPVNENKRDVGALRLGRKVGTAGKGATIARSSPDKVHPDQSRTSAWFSTTLGLCGAQLGSQLRKLTVGPSR